MARVDLDLRLPEGSPIPSEIAVGQGSLFFRADQLGLQATPDILTRAEIQNVGADTELYFDVVGVSSNKFFRVDFRYENSNNHYQLVFTDNTDGGSIGVLEIRWQKKINGNTSTTNIDLTPFVGQYAQGTLYQFAVIASGEDVSLLVFDGTNYQVAYTEKDTQLNSNGRAFIQMPAGRFYMPAFSYEDNTGAGEVTPDPDPTPDPIPTLNLPKFISGYKRQFTKLGQLFDKPSTMPDDREYWFRPFLTAGIAGFPSDKYPVAAVSSSNHATGNGGIYLRVYEEKGLYDLNNRDSWYEWPEVSNLAEFNHITKKTNPVFTYTGRDSHQTETPQVFVEDNGSVVMYFHNSSVDLSDLGIDPDCQTTMYTVATSFPDFGTPQPANFVYSPWRLEGDAHTGYFRGGKNTFRGVPYDYIGNTLLGSNGNGSTSRRYVVGNSIRDFQHYVIASRVYGALRDYSEVPSNKVLVVELMHDAKREGAYNRIMGNLKLETGGGAATDGAQFEVLMDDYLNIVSRPSIFVNRGASGEWDESEISNYDEISYAGKDYGFYNTTLSSGSSGIGIGLVEDVPHNWELHYTGGGRNELVVSESASGQIAPDWTFSQTPNTFFEAPSDLHTDKYNYTEMVLPQNGDISTAVHSTGIKLRDYGIIDVYFTRIGKKSGDGILAEFGLTDDVNTLANAINYRWYASNGSSTASDAWMYADVSIDGTVEQNRTSNHIGQASSWKTIDGESATAKHEVGFRIIPSQNRLIMLEGVSETNVFDITGFDYDAVLNLFIKANIATSASADSGIVFDSVKVVTYTDESIAVPSVPTITTSKTEDTVTVTSSNVSGATGYKYFLDNQSNDTGVFTGLEPETEYTVYARASNALGDSAPSTIQTVTTDAAIPVNQPPTANAGPDQSVAAATQFTLDGTGSQDTDGTILEWRWTQTAGDTVTLNLDDPARPTAKSPSKTTAQRLTFQLVTVDDEGAESSPGSVNIDVAAFAVSEMLKLLDTRQWTVVNDGSVQAFEGRSNREAFRFLVTPSDGIQTSAEGYFLFDQPGVHAVEVISTPTSKISSVDDPHMIRGDVIAARIGDLQTDENGNLTLTFVLYVTDDKDGLVMTAKVIEPYQKASYFRKQG